MSDTKVKMNTHCVICYSRDVTLLSIRNNLSYYHCMNCGHCELSGSPNQKEDSFDIAQEKYYGSETNLQREKPSIFDNEILFVRKKIVGPILSRECAVLEVGPGSGEFAMWLFDNGHQVTCIEHSDLLASLLAKRIDASVVSGEFEKCNIENGSIDIFCSFHVIEHVREPLAHLQKAYNVVRVGGYAFIATPNAESWQQRAFPMLSPNFDSAHLRVFSRSSLHRLCEEAGWNVIDVITPEHTIYWIRVLTKMLRRLKGEDEEETAGKYSGKSSALMHGISCTASIVTYPLRLIQRVLGGGNELFFILRKYS